MRARAVSRSIGTERDARARFGRGRDRCWAGRRRVSMRRAVRGGRARATRSGAEGALPFIQAPGRLTGGGCRVPRGLGRSGARRGLHLPAARAESAHPVEPAASACPPRQRAAVRPLRVPGMRGDSETLWRGNSSPVVPTETGAGRTPTARAARSGEGEVRSRCVDEVLRPPRLCAARNLPPSSYVPSSHLVSARRAAGSRADRTGRQDARQLPRRGPRIRPGASRQFALRCPHPAPSRGRRVTPPGNRNEGRFGNQLSG